MTSGSGQVVVLVTASSEVESGKIADTLLEQRKAACVSVVPGVVSRFWWQGKLDSARESLLIIKTRAALVPEIVELVKKVHSYTVPEVVALPVVAGNRDHLDWLDRETTAGPS